MQTHTLRTILVTFVLSVFGAHIFVPAFVYATQSDPTTIVGIKKSRTSRILDTFKDQEKVLLFENVPFSSDDELGIFNAERKMNSLSDILKRLQSSKEQYKEQKRIVTREKITLKRTISELDASITETEQSIKDTESRISEKNREIAQYTQHIEELQQKIAINKEAILKYLTYIYSK